MLILKYEVIITNIAVPAAEKFIIKKSITINIKRYQNQSQERRYYVDFIVKNALNLYRLQAKKINDRNFALRDAKDCIGNIDKTGTSTKLWLIMVKFTIKIR